mmetsp:Transcript_28583/g.32072  ORF Transcript_28583/g.32072 Transcript_28583/m.32072 type:complete len:92 (+) Transcript_28583:129-404(+)
MKVTMTKEMKMAYFCVPLPFATKTNEKDVRLIRLLDGPGGDGDGDREEYCQISTMICILSNNNNKSNRINNKKGRENPPLQTMKIKYKYNR